MKYFSREFYNSWKCQMYILELQNAMSKIRSHSMCLTED